MFRRQPIIKSSTTWYANGASEMLALVVYLMGTPLRRKAIRQQEQQARQEAAVGPIQTDSAVQPDAGGHAAALPEVAAVPAVGKEERRP